MREVKGNGQKSNNHNFSGKKSEKRQNKALEKEIFTALSEIPIEIPWVKKVEKVTVTDEQ